MVTTWTHEAIPSYVHDVDYEQVWTHERSWGRAHIVTRVSGQAMFSRLTDGLAVTRRSFDEFKLEGYTVDNNEDPISGAEVYLCIAYAWGYHVLQKTTSGVDGSYIFYVENPDDEYAVISWKWDGDEYIRGVTDRNLKAMAS